MVQERFQACCTTFLETKALGMRSIALLQLTSPVALSGLQLSALLVLHYNLCAAQHLQAAKTVPYCTPPVGGQLKQPSARVCRTDQQAAPALALFVLLDGFLQPSPGLSSNSGSTASSTSGFTVGTLQVPVRVVKAGQHATLALCPKDSPAMAATEARAASLHVLHSGSAGQGAAAAHSTLQAGAQAVQPAPAVVTPAQAGVAYKGLMAHAPAQPAQAVQQALAVAPAPQKGCVAEVPAKATQQAPAAVPAEAGVANRAYVAEAPAQAAQHAPAAAVPEQVEAADGTSRSEPPAAAAAPQQVPESRAPAVDRSVLDFRIHCCAAARAAPGQTGWKVPATAGAAPSLSAERASDTGREDKAPGQTGWPVPAAAGASPAAAAAAQLSAERASDAAWALQVGLISSDHPSQASRAPLPQASALVVGSGPEAGSAPVACKASAPAAAALQCAVAASALTVGHKDDESPLPIATALLDDGSGSVIGSRAAAGEAAVPLAPALRGAGACPVQTAGEAPAPQSPALRGGSDAVACPAPAAGARASSKAALSSPSSPDAALASSFEDRPRQGQAAVACSPPNWRKVSTVDA